MSREPAEETEVLIVGAGPAGCTLGMLLAGKGLRVLILEKEQTDRHKVCGDLLGPRCLWLLDVLRLDRRRWEWKGTPVRSIRVYDETGLRSWAGFSGARACEAPATTMRRDRFDRVLRESASESGCRILYGVGFDSLVGREGGALVCRTRGAGGQRLFRAGIVVGADGSNSAVAKAAGLDEQRLEKKILAVRGYFRNVRGLGESIELYFLRRYLPGYAWVIPVNAGTANIGLGLRADVCIRKRLKLNRELERFLSGHPDLASRMSGSEPSGRIRGWPIGVYDSRKKRSDRNLLLLGDAACLADPLTGEGIYSAMRSAFLAAPVVLDAFASGDFSGARLSRYDREVRRYFDRSCRFAGFLSSLPSDHRWLQPLVAWGLERVESGCLTDETYASMVGGFFTGMIPRRRMWNRKFFRRTFLGC